VLETDGCREQRAATTAAMTIGVPQMIHSSAGKCGLSKSYWQMRPVRPAGSNSPQFSQPHPLRHDLKAKPDICGSVTFLHPRGVGRRMSRLPSGGWLGGIACHGSD